jgi:hypothetical protein
MTEIVENIITTSWKKIEEINYYKKLRARSRLQIRDVDNTYKVYFYFWQSDKSFSSFEEKWVADEQTKNFSIFLLKILVIQTSATE